MRLLIPLILFPVITVCQILKTSKTAYYFPAEWEKQQGMIISFDNELNADSVSVNMVKALSTTMKVYCMIVADSLVPYYKTWFKKENVKMDNIQFMLFGNSGTYSIRDPIFFLKNNNHEYRVMDFRWSLWGFLPDSIYINDFRKWLANERKNFNDNFLRTFPYPTVQSGMAAEGGAIEINGKGVVVQVEAVNMNRNPGMTKTEQENELKRVLGAKKIIWLKQGAAEDPFQNTKITGNYFGNGVGGHIDDFCRFADPETILLAYPDSADTINNPVAKVNLDRMKINYEILQNATDQAGKHFKIVKFPVPYADLEMNILDTMSSDKKLNDFSKSVLWRYPNYKIGDTCYFVPACSYLNYLVANNKILIPKYWKEGKPESMKQKDEMVKKIFEKYFPGKEIIQINPSGFNHKGGGIHCWSQQIPE